MEFWLPPTTHVDNMQGMLSVLRGGYVSPGAASQSVQGRQSQHQLQQEDHRAGTVARWQQPLQGGRASKLATISAKATRPAAAITGSLPSGAVTTALQI